MAGSGLRSGELIFIGDSILSNNGAYELMFQRDGNLVLRHKDLYPGPHKALWASDTEGSGATELRMFDGRLVLVNDSGPSPVEIWSRGAGGNPEAYFTVQDDGNLVIYRPKTPVWATGTVRPVAHGPVVAGRHALSAPYSLPVGQELVSAHGAFRLALQTDGNLVLYAGSEVLWKTGTEGKVVDRLVMQADGNLVVLGGGVPVWASGTINPNAYLVMQDDANAVIYADKALWASR